MLVEPNVPEAANTTLHISFQAVESNVWLCASSDGIILAEGWMAQHWVNYEAVKQLQQQYQEQLSFVRQLAQDGIANPPIDQQELIDLGWQVTTMLPDAMISQIYELVWYGQHSILSLEFDQSLQHLLCVPWEFMVVALDQQSTQFGFLSLDSKVCLVRQIQGLGTFSPVQFEQTPRIHALAAQPYDQEAIAVDSTRHTLTHQAHSNWYQGESSLAMLQQWIRHDQPEVLHLLCHGVYLDNGRATANYELLLSHADGYTQRITAIDLMRVLRLAPSLRAVVLQACHSGELTMRSVQGTEQLVAGVAVSLMQMGIPLVVAMQGCITQAAADAFVQGYYETLAYTNNLAWAVNAGRVAMYTYGNMVEWSLPVIYQGQSIATNQSWYSRMLR